VRQGYSGRALVPLVDPSAVEAAFAVGVGGVLGGDAINSPAAGRRTAKRTAKLGGSFDGRFSLRGVSHSSIGIRDQLASEMMI
jgi:hypothetical protein